MIVNGISVTTGLGRWRYMLTAPYTIQTGITLPHDCVFDKFTWYADGGLHINTGFCWDGCTGLGSLQPKTALRASLLHDCMCQLTNAGLLPWEPYRHKGDILFLSTVLEDGMLPFAAFQFYRAIRLNSTTKKR